MIDRRVLAASAATAILAIAAAVALTGHRGPDLAPRPVAERPTVALLTSLPLVFGESFGLDSGGSPALTRLEQRYNVLPIGVADEASLAGQGLLVMAHPRAQPATALVDLDHWVRAGGRMLLLADPKLDWDSHHPLGDPLRPPPDFADTGLLKHWRLELAGPAQDGPAQQEAGGRAVRVSSPGLLSSSGACKVEADGFIARCRLGKGRATVIADADFLNVGESPERGDGGAENLVEARRARILMRDFPTCLSTGVIARNKGRTIP